METRPINSIKKTARWLHSHVKSLYSVIKSNVLHLQDKHRNNRNEYRGTNGEAELVPSRRKLFPSYSCANQLLCLQVQFVHSIVFYVGRILRSAPRAFQR